MQSKPILTLDDVKKIAAAAEAEAVKNNWAVAIAIVDDGGHLLWLQRMDGVAPISSHIAPSKAKTAALGRRESRIYEEMINGGRVSFLSAPEIDGLLEGGVPIMKDGQCLGAVGVSVVLHALVVALYGVEHGIVGVADLLRQLAEPVRIRRRVDSL